MSDSQSSSRGSRPGSFVPPSLADLDAVLSAYEFIEILGQGGMGAVYRVRQHSLNRMAAIKVMPQFEEEEGERFGERFQREAQAMGRLSHPNIVSVYDFGRTSDGMLYIVMEYIEGADLQQLLQTGELTVDHLFDWIPQICEALQYAHSQGIVHRDIKPANIMITNDGVVKVADFGLAKLTGGDEQHPRLTMTNMAMGTPDYVAPEVLETGVEIDHRADIYAVGVMLYEMLTGKIPRGAWRPPSEVNSHIDSRFDSIVVKAMDSDRDSRFQQASEITASLSSIWATTDDRVPLITEKDGSPTGRKTGSRNQLPGPSKRSGTPIWIGAAVGLILLSLAGFFFLKEEPAGSANQVDSVEERPNIAAGSAISAPASATSGSIDAKEAPSTRPLSADTTREEESSGVVTVPSAPVPVRESRESDAESGTEKPRAPEPSEKTGESLTKIASPATSQSAGPQPETPGTPAPSQTKSTGPDPAAGSDTPLPPPTEASRRIAELLERYREGYNRTMLATHEQSVRDLQGNYGRALNRQKEASAATGNLDDVLALGEEIRRLENNEPLPDQNPEIPDVVQGLQNTYRDQMGRLEKDHLARIATLVEPLRSAFASLEQEFTKQEKVDDALEVRNAWRQIESDGFPFVEFESASLFKTTEAAEEKAIAATETRKAPIGSDAEEIEAGEAAIADRKAAEWVLTKGGRIEIQIGRNKAELKGQGTESAKEAADLLPEKDFQLVVVDFAGNRNFSSEEFAKLPPSPGLQELNLDQTLFGDRNSTRVLRGFPGLISLDVPHEGADEWARAIVDHPTLREVSFYRTLLTEGGARELAKATWLETLQLSECRIGPGAIDSIAQMTSLKWLGLSHMLESFGNEELAKLAALPNLETLMIHRWDVSSEAIRAFKRTHPDCTILYTGDDGGEIRE